MVSACVKCYGVERKPETLNTFDLLVVFSYFPGCSATCWSASGVSYSLAFLSLLRAWKPNTALPEVGCYYFLFPASEIYCTNLFPLTLASQCSWLPLLFLHRICGNFWIHVCLFIYLLKINILFNGREGHSIHWATPARAKISHFKCWHII